MKGHKTEEKEGEEKEATGKEESSPVAVMWSSTAGRWGLGVKANKVSQVLRMICFELLVAQISRLHVFR